MSRKQIVIIIILLFVVLLGVALWLYMLPSNKQPAASTSQPATVTINPDTGEQTVNDPSLSKVESQDATNILLYGIPDLIDATNMNQQQVDYIKQELYNYSAQNLKDKYDALTVRPQDTKANGDTVTSTIRFGEGDTIVNLQINGLTSGKMQLIVTDPTGKNGGNYSSPIVTVYGD